MAIRAIPVNTIWMPSTRARAGHLHAATISTWFVHVYLMPLER